MTPKQRRLARAAERERLRQKQQRNKRAALILVALVVVIIGVGILSLTLLAHADVETGEEIPPSANTSEQVKLKQLSDYYFFEEERSQRYLEYLVVYPNMAPEEVIVQVNLDLDTIPYTDSTPVTNPESLLVLTNKHNYLPRSYEPADLVSVGDILIRSEAAGPLQQLVAAAWDDGVSLYLSSGVRDAAYQEVLYNNLVNSIGVKWADLQSARPGYSEHQTGWAVDFSPSNYQFYETPAAYWIEENAYKYGFIVRYTEENDKMTLYIHEPWHIRYVGSEVAQFMHDNEIGSFEEYWVRYIQHTPSVQRGLPGMPVTGMVTGSQ
ncbi:MAG: M15 family metallopeptidase [Coriobacteriales bacterium]|jgi:D-alanyl-D-alanine carboxypeptidase|nr:M15 family metallopeptidase [Coriobacteriales bacterium]